MKKTKKNQNRNYGIDLLRLLAMYMVVIMHVLAQGGVMGGTVASSAQYEVIWFLEIAAFCATNCYALITGYVSIGSKFRYSTLIILWLRVLFYTVLITIICAIVHPEWVDKNAWVQAIFPAMTEQYWYFTAYFCMFFFIPLLNAAVHNMQREKLRQMIMVILVASFVGPILFKHDAMGVSGGYTTFWLMILYIIGAYIKKYNVIETVNAKKCLRGYFYIIVLMWLVKLIIEMTSQRVSGQAWDGGRLIRYNSPTIVGAALCLFFFFAKLNVGKTFHGVIRVLSPLVFSVYLIHVHPLIWDNVIKDRFASYAEQPAPLLGLTILGIAFTIFVGCLIIDMVREFIFSALHVKEAVQRMEQKIESKYIK